jgi:hypothetical protein
MPDQENARCFDHHQAGHCLRRLRQRGSCGQFLSQVEPASGAAPLNPKRSISSSSPARRWSWISPRCEASVRDRRPQAGVQSGQRHAGALALRQLRRIHCAHSELANRDLVILQAETAEILTAHDRRNFNNIFRPQCLFENLRQALRQLRVIVGRRGVFAIAGDTIGARDAGMPSAMAIP